MTDFAILPSPVRFDARIGLGVGPESHSAIQTIQCATFADALKVLRESPYPSGWQIAARITKDGSYQTNAWVVISGTEDMRRASSDPSMLSIVSDIVGPAFEVKQGLSGGWIFSAIDGDDKQVFCIEKSGKLQWGDGDRGDLDVSLEREAPGLLKTSGDFRSARYFIGGAALSDYENLNVIGNGRFQQTSNTLNSTVVLRRSRASDANLQNGDYVGSLLGDARFNSLYNDVGRVDVLYTGNGTTRKGQVAISTSGTNNGICVKDSGVLNLKSVSEYTDNAAALTGGLVSGDLYRTGDVVKIAHA